MCVIHSRPCAGRPRRRSTGENNIYAKFALAVATTIVDRIRVVSLLLLLVHIISNSLCYPFGHTEHKHTRTNTGVVSILALIAEYHRGARTHKLAYIYLLQRPARRGWSRSISANGTHTHTHTHTHTNDTICVCALATLYVWCLCRACAGHNVRLTLRQ